MSSVELELNELLVGNLTIGRNIFISLRLEEVHVDNTLKGQASIVLS